MDEMRTDQHWLWLTDIHLDFLGDAGLLDFVKRLNGMDAGGLIISGDIATGSDLALKLQFMADHFKGKICFVLGNHDYYGRSIRVVRETVTNLTRDHDRLCWLPEMDAIQLRPQLALLGQDGWCDGRAGDYEGSGIRLNDFGMIDDLRRKTKAERLTIIQEISDQETAWAERRLREALDAYRDVIFVTHVPPFAEVSLGPDGRVHLDWVPFFCAQTMGNRLVAIMHEHPNHRLLVLCGHTHTQAVSRILPNLTVRVGGAKYGMPGLSGIIDFDDLEAMF